MTAWLYKHKQTTFCVCLFFMGWIQIYFKILTYSYHISLLLFNPDELLGKHMIIYWLLYKNMSIFWNKFVFTPWKINTRKMSFVCVYIAKLSYLLTAFNGGDISRHNKIFKMKSLILKKMSMLILVIKY
jgi:hypothetical protein